MRSRSCFASGATARSRSAFVLRALSFERHLPTRVLLDHSAPEYTTNVEFWDREATALLLTVIAVVLMLVDRRTPPPEEWLDDAEPECLWVRALSTGDGTKSRRPRA